MKFFLDENFPRSALLSLRSVGHIAVHTLEIFPPGTADDLLFTHAQQEQAVFITTDKDFYHTVPLAFARHHGAIVITLRRPNRDELLRRLTDALQALGVRTLENTVWLITDTRIYSRQQPID
jgi:predicted nuclease of predicted toxin-antitoxin system